MMASISTKYYQFLLSQGICSPLGASMIFFPAMSTVVTWFHKKRGIALGLTAVGSSLGGVILPIMVARLVPKVGFGWTMRICAFLILGLLIVSNLTVKSRIPPHPRPVKIMDFISPLREPPFFLLSVGMFLYFFGMDALTCCGYSCLLSSRRLSTVHLCCFESTGGRDGS